MVQKKNLDFFWSNGVLQRNSAFCFNEKTHFRPASNGSDDVAKVESVIRKVFVDSQGVHVRCQESNRLSAQSIRGRLRNPIVKEGFRIRFEFRNSSFFEEDNLERECKN